MTGMPMKLRNTVWSEPLPMRVSARVEFRTPELNGPDCADAFSRSTVAFESEADDGHADEVEEYSVVGAAADAGIGEGGVQDSGIEWARLRGRFLALNRRLPRVVETFSCVILQ